MGVQFAAGFDNVAGLADIAVVYRGVTWQPRITGLKIGRRIQTGDGHIVKRGFLSAAMRFGFQYLAQYGAFLAQTGLDSAESVECTLSLPNNDDRTYTNYNAILIKPDIPDDGVWYGTNSNPRAKLVEVVFNVTHIEEIS